MFIFQPVFNLDWVLKYRKNYQHIKSLYTLGYRDCLDWVLKYRKNYQHIKSLYTLGYEVFKDFRMGYENLKGNLDRS